MPKRSTANSATIPPPVLGWNTRDPISNMDQQYAVEIENYFPANGTVDLRNGYRSHSTGVGNDLVLALGVLEYGASVSKLVSYATSNHRLYDSTATGAATDISGGVGFANDIVFMPQFRDRLIIKMLSGTQDVYSYTGTGNIALANFTGPGGDDKDLGVIGIYKSRVYFAQLSVPSIWYGDVNAITGALTEFPILSEFTQGIKYIYFLGPMTRVKQYEENDLFCIISDQGEVLVYSGESPEATNWEIIGRYTIPKPISFKAFFYFGGTLHVITRLGVISMQDVMQGNRAGGTWNFLSGIITSEFKRAFPANAFQTVVGTGLTVPSAEYLLVNVPIFTASSITSIEQWVMNINTGAWAKFTGQTAYSWVNYNEEIYFGGTNGKVFKANNGYFDEDPADSAEILSRTTKLRPAYNYFGDRSLKKQFSYANVLLRESEGLNLTVDADVDYADTTPTSTLTDTTDTSYKRYVARAGLHGIGKCASINFEQTVTTKRRSIEAIEVIWNDGDI